MPTTTKAAATTAAPAATCAHAACGKKLGPPVLCCSRCKKVKYCSKPCQTAAWKAGHKKECGKLRAAAEEAELLARLYRLEKKGDSLGMLRLEAKALALAKKLRDSDLKTAGFILNLIGLSHDRTGSYARACELHEQHRAICEALGDHVGMAAACGNLGRCNHSTGDYARARELHEQHRAICEALGDHAEAAAACGNLGNCYYSTGDYVRAREMHEQDRAICEALADDVGMAGACANLGCCHYRMGDYGQARELHEQARAIFEALGDRAGVARACGNLGNCYDSTGDHGRALELHEQARAIFEALGDRAGVAAACFNLGDCCLNTGDYEQAISYFTEQYDMAKEMQVVISEADAALGVGVALRLLIRDDARGGDDRVQEAGQWLQTALDSGCAAARLHLARLAWDAGDEYTALAHLQRYLSWCVECGPKQCAGCGQTRGDNVHMLTCGGCRVARFCSAEHQRMASRDASKGGCLLLGRHKDVCGVLGMWRQRVVKDGAPPDALRAELLAFLRR